MEQESPPAKPVLDELNLAHIHQYLDGIVKTSFHDEKPLRINEGRHSFARSESISKRDQDLTDFLQKNFKKPGLKLKGVSSDNSQVSTTFYSTNLSRPHIEELLMKKKKRLNLCLHLLMIFKLLKPLFFKVN